MPHLPHPLARPARRRAALVAAVAAAVILLIECVGFNLPFWRTLGASMDSASAANTMGPGLEVTDTGRLRVTDPTAAWLEVKADGSSDYARVDALEPKQDALRVIHLRVTFTGADGHGGAASIGHPSPTRSFQAEQTVSPWAPRSLYLKAHGSGVMRVWIEESKDAVIPIRAVRANVRVPFSFSPVRVALMAGAVILIALWRPGSRLWRIALDPRDGRQRLAFAGLVAPFAAVAATNVVWQMMYATPLSFHTPGGLTYDIDQYGHLADALLSGHVWLDLIVPDGLAKASDPYDVTTRLRLLAEGVDPIYWDYAFHDGRWYSYFGVVPAVLLFAPYRALTGRMLSSAAAVHLLMFVALVFAWLLTIRLIGRIRPRTSLAATSMALLFVPMAGGFGYLFFRTNFYSVPFAASLTFTMAGLWLWVGAQTTKPPVRPAHRWRMDGAPELSLPRLAAGSACIAANFGCRPTFCLAALLGIPLFWPQLRAMAANLASGRVAWTRAATAPAVVLGAALIPLMPLVWYNHARFGSFLDFGNDYQMTVTDMGAFRQPAADILPMVGSYLLLPLRLTADFPFVALSPPALPEWAFAEPLVGGLFALCPPALLSFATLVPRWRRRMTAERAEAGGVGLMMPSMVVLGLALTVFDTVSAGLGWRYMCDFAWLFAFASLPALLRLLDGPAQERTKAGDPASTSFGPGGGKATAIVPPPAMPRRIARLAVSALLYWSLLVAVLCCFTLGRQDQMITTNPGLLYDVASWFTL